MSVNDWGARIARNAREAMAREAAGMGQIALYVRDDVMPYIGMRVQEGAMTWRPDSDEAVAAVTLDMMQAAGVDSVKGLEKSSPEYASTRNAQGFIRRAVAFYRAVSLLTEKHEVAPEWHTGKAAPQFPLAWFCPDDRELISAKGVATHARISGKAKVTILTLKDGSLAPVSVTISEASIVAASKPKTQREASQSSDTAPETLQGALDATASMLAKADHAISGDASDAFVAMLEAFISASPANLALVAGLVDAAQNESATKAA